MTWVFSLHYLGFDVESIAKVLTRSIPLVVLVLPLLVTADKWVGVTLSYLTFILLVKNVHEHYIMWSTIPLIITYLKHRRVLCLGAALFGILSMTQQSDRGVYIAGSTVHMYSVVLGLVYFCVC